MKKGLTEIVFILDRSGSMAGLHVPSAAAGKSGLRRIFRRENNGRSIAGEQKPDGTGTYVIVKNI